MFFAVNKQSGFVDILFSVCVDVLMHECVCVFSIWCPIVKLARRPWNPATPAG